MGYRLGTDDELEDIELGDRAAFWAVSYLLAASYSTVRDRERFTALTMFGSVCERVREDTGEQDVTGLVPAAWIPVPD